MPDLSPEIIEDLEVRLINFLKTKPDYKNVNFIAPGGSAAVFRVETPGGQKALKVFDPKFLSGPGSEAEKHRLEIQRGLIGHECKGLVKIFSIDEFEGTAIVEMEYAAWPQLKKKLAEVPDDKIENLIGQLVEVVNFLESKDIVHRDIKPENIHISEDFNSLLLLDLGVARNIDLSDNVDASLTDQNNTRPFVATAQYSPPEYLFRLDEPSPKLWKGLNLYQVGAVLHDLIQKEPLFQHEINLGNRWLVAKAVLTKTPSFKDGVPERLSQLKSLSLKCLNKNLDIRLSLVDWNDFTPLGKQTNVDKLKDLLSKKTLSSQLGANPNKLDFSRRQFFSRFKDKLRDLLVNICGTKLPPITNQLPESPFAFRCLFNLDRKLCLLIFLDIEWQEGLYEQVGNIYGSAIIDCDDGSHNHPAVSKVLLNTVSIDVSDETFINDILNRIAGVLTQSLELLELTPDSSVLINKELNM